MASKETYTCRCGAEFTARTADRARGWARFCSKRCKAVEQEGRTGQYKARRDASESEEIDHEGGGWDAHKGIF